MEIEPMYEQLGVSRAVYEYGEAVLRDLRPRFDAIDQTAEYNQGKVLHAMQENKVSAACFAATTGYGYNDRGREKLDELCADIFGAEKAIIRAGMLSCGRSAFSLLSASAGRLANFPPRSGSITHTGRP